MKRICSHVIKDKPISHIQLRKKTAFHNLIKLITGWTPKAACKQRLIFLVFLSGGKKLFKFLLLFMQYWIWGWLRAFFIRSLNIPMKGRPRGKGNDAPSELYLRKANPQKWAIFPILKYSSKNWDVPLKKKRSVNKLPNKPFCYL